MTLEIFVVIAIAQGAFLVALVLLMLANRARRRHHGRDAAMLDAGVADTFTQWLLGNTGTDTVVRQLREVDPETALEQAMEAVAKRIPPERRDELVAGLRGEPWVAHFLKRATSRIWWRRLEAARTLTVAGVPGDRALLLALLADEHPAVQLAAAGALDRIADAELVGSALDSLADRPIVVRRIQVQALLRLWAQTGPVLLARLRSEAPARQVESWVTMAELSADPACVAAAAELFAHPDPNVRAAVARALRHYFSPRLTERLAALLRDPEWPVRAAASRTAGAMADPALLPALRDATHDRAWWVRFRAALSLAQMGEPGRRVLREVREGNDPFARDMATMVSGLSDGGVLELAET